jgi:hypothetical protein
MRPTRLSLAVIPALLVLAASPAGAVAKTRTATDHLSGVRFTLKGRALTLRVVPQPKPTAVREKLFGHRLHGVCGFNGADGHPVGTGVTAVTFTWKRGDLSRTVRLPRDISATADWCVVEAAGDGGDVAGVDFGLGHNPDE